MTVKARMFLSWRNSEVTSNTDRQIQSLTTGTVYTM